VPQPPSAKYFAVEPREQIGSCLVSKLTDLDGNKSLTGLSQIVHDAYLYYYGFDPEGFHGTSAIHRAGEQGELAEFRINHARALVNALKNLVTNQKLIWRPKAASFSAEAVREVELATNILEYYWTEKQVAQYADLAVEQAIALTEGFVFTPWDDFAGEYLGEDPNTPGKHVFSGDVTFFSVPWWDVYRDPKKQAWNQLDWVVVRLPWNRYDLAARHRFDPNQDPEQPSLEDRILAAPERAKDSVRSGAKSGAGSQDSDDISVYHFFHRRSAVLPKGREVVFLGDGTVLSDTTLTYEDVPLHRVTPAELVGTPFGYSQFLEVMGIQELIDSLASAIATNQTTFATQNVIVDQGTQIAPDQLPGGLRLIYKPPGTEGPKPLQLTSSPKEVFEFLETLKADQQRLFGLNDVVMGDAPSKDMSGAGMALLSQSALQQSSTLQANYIRMVQSIGTSILGTLRSRMTVPRTLDIVGKQNAFLVKPPEEYSGKNLGRVSKVLVDIGNPMEQTPTGRFELGQQMIQLGVKLNVDQMQQLVSTGRMDPLTRRLQSELLNILSENEAIAAGQPPDAMLHDDHLLHGREHSVPVANPEARKDPSVLDAHMKHMHMHYELYFGVPAGQYVPGPPDPATGAPGKPQFQAADPMYHDRMLILMGIQPPPPMGPPPGPPPGMGPSGPLPPGDEGPPPGAAPPEAPPGPTMAGPQAPNLPSMPTNPSTGQEWNPVDAGGAVQPPA
jgi:hypothetical protein